MNSPTRLRIYAAAALLCAARLPAQTAPEAKPPTDDVLELEKLSVNGVAPEQQILPTSRPFSSVFGTNDNIVDVPRNVTIISRQQLSDINISSVLDFAKLTSSSYTTTNFGAPANPSIRGQTADLFINGVRGRITSNGNGLPLNFNAVESVNIVKGPATAVQGTSMYVGGFIDLVTKRPYFDSFKGTISATLGSYGQKEWTIDAGGPLSKELAYRVSYSGTDSNGYWHDYYNKNNSIYGALSFRPTEKYELFINASASWFRYTENWGINRVTQDLIDNGNYITGININNGATATPSDPQNSKYVYGNAPDAFFPGQPGNILKLGPTVKINRHARLLKPSDHSTGREFNAQAIQTFQVSPDLKVVNNSFASYTARNTLSSYYYSEIVDPSWFAENRTEFIFTKPFASINTGIDLRYQRTKAYDDYFTEPANVWDITKDTNFINVYNSIYFPNPFTSFPVPGWPGRYATDGVTNGDTNDSHATTFGPFFQATWKASDKVNVVTGVRYDHISADVKDPLSSPTIVHDSIGVWIPSYNGSLIFKPTTASSIYVTYNYSQNTSGAVGNGGGITGWGAGNKLDKENFTQPSELVEVGTKYALYQNKVFLNFAVFDQKRTAKTTSSNDIVKFHSKGFEAEFNYQPNKHVYATLSYSYIDATVTPGFQSDGGVALLPTEGFEYGKTNSVSGLPKSSFNGLISYTFDNGWGVSANTVVTGKINNNYAGTLVIPWQYELDASVSYHYKQWDYRLSVGNLTDQNNWAPPNSVYGNASIFALAGTTFSLNAKYKF